MSVRPLVVVIGEWLPLPHTPRSGRATSYWCSPAGEVINNLARPLKPWRRPDCKTPFIRVRGRDICTFPLPQLVASLYLPPQPAGTVLRTRDGNWNNYRAENLFWATPEAVVDGWRVCKRYPLYEIRRDGTIRNIRTQRIHRTHEACGKQYVTLTAGSATGVEAVVEPILRLVAETWHNSPHRTDGVWESGVDGVDGVPVFVPYSSAEYQARLSRRGEQNFNAVANAHGERLIADAFVRLSDDDLLALLRICVVEDRWSEAFRQCRSTLFDIASRQQHGRDIADAQSIACEVWSEVLRTPPATASSLADFWKVVESRVKAEIQELQQSQIVWRSVSLDTPLDNDFTIADTIADQRCSQSSLVALNEVLDRITPLPLTALERAALIDLAYGRTTTAEIDAEFPGLLQRCRTALTA